MIITSCGNSIPIAKAIAKALKAKFSPLTISSFPDNDIYMKYNVDVKKQIVVIVHSLQPNPDTSLFDVTFAAHTAKDLGAKKVILVAPYLSYMRQDKRFHPGEAITSRIMAKMLNPCIDHLITIDPHLHRYKSLRDIFTMKTSCLTANNILAKYIKTHFNHPVIIGPDWESYQWAEDIAKEVGTQVTIMEKTRFSSRHVTSKMIHPVMLKDREIVVVDDILSTGHTICEAAKNAYNAGAHRVGAVVVHGLFVEDARSKLKKAHVNDLASTNTIEHPTNRIDVTELLVEELKKIIK
ncbi:ribose-phosphate diphosphokinase [Candidatus Woesearchaeota archaeon]|nr:ribose-phosphate diphosphokinase [Candidatus Woesearchaeota archaeon]